MPKICCPKKTGLEFYKGLGEGILKITGLQLLFEKRTGLQLLFEEEGQINVYPQVYKEQIVHIWIHTESKANTPKVTDVIFSN